MKEKYLTIEDDSVSEEDKYEYEEGAEDDDIETDLDTETLLSSPNIATLLTEDELQNIGEECLENYESDKLSRSHREPAMEKALNLALHITKQKDTPWKNASNVVYPLISNASISFAARAYPAIVRDDEVVDFKVNGSDEGRQVPVVRDGHMLVQNGQPAMEVVGKGIKKARGERVKNYMNFQFTEELESWEEDTDRLLHALPVTGTMFRKIYWCADEQVMKSHLVYPKYLIVNDKTATMERAPCVSEELEYYPHEIEEFIRSDMWMDFNFADDSGEKEEESEREKEGASDEENRPHIFIEQLCRIDLDKDGYPEPYIVRIHKGLKKVVNIVANYKSDMIKFNSKKEICRIIPETYYIKYDFIPSPDGSFYSIGFGELLLHMNETINTLINQLIDAGTLATTSSGFIGRGLRIKSGNVQVKKGEYVQVDTRGGAIKDNFVQITHPEPSQTLFQLLGLLLESAKDLGSLKDVLSGEQISAQQSPTTTLTLIEQGLTAFKAIYKRISRSVKKEIKALYRLNSLYLNQEPAMNGFEISQQDFSGKDFSIVPASAPHMVSDMQRLARASFMETYKDDPYVDGLELRTRIFDIAGIDNLDTLLRQPAPQEDPNMAMVKVQQELGQSQIQIEQYKAQIKDKEAMFKSQEQAANVQLKQQEFQLKAQVENQKAQNQMLQNQIKMQDQEFNLRSLMQESALSAQNSQHDANLKAAKTQAEVHKLGVQAFEILSKIELEKLKAQLEMSDRQNQRQELEESKELTGIKEALQNLADNKTNDIQDVIKPLVDAIAAIKTENESVVEIKNMMASQHMAQAIQPLADAVRSLKETEKPVTKRFKATRNKDGTLEGEIITEENGISD